MFLKLPKHFGYAHIEQKLLKDALIEVEILRNIIYIKIMDFNQMYRQKDGFRFKKIFTEIPGSSKLDNLNSNRIIIF